MLRFTLQVVPCFVALAFAAGCSSTSTEEVAEESDVTQAAIEEPEVKTECANVDVPTCADGKTLRMSLDAEGCLVPRCVALCETKPAPTCKAGETLRAATDESGCSVSYCFTE